MHASVESLLAQFPGNSILGKVAHDIAKECDTDIYDATSEIITGLGKLLEAERSFQHARTYISTPPPITSPPPAPVVDKRERNGGLSNRV